MPRAQPLTAVVSIAVHLAVAGPVLAQTAPVTLEPLEPIGCFDCDGPALFGSIQALAVTTTGGVVVGDRDPPMVRLFGPDGEPVGTFGRRGEGPGEFRYVSGVAPLADGGVLVSDMMRPRLTAFGPDGEVRGTTRLGGAVMRLQSGPRGRSVAAQEAQWATMSAAVHLVGATGAVIATPLATTAERILDPEGHPVAPGLLSMAIDGDGRVAVAESYTYRISILDATGAEVAVVGRDIPRTERTPEEVADLAAAFARGPGAAEAVAAGGSASDAPKPRRVDPLRPHFPMGALAWDDDDRLWVKTARGGPGRTVFDLFGSDGAFLGELGVELELGDWAVGRGMLVGVSEDPEFGVNTVARWRVSG